jgi:hypothetical protein
MRSIGGRAVKFFEKVSQNSLGKQGVERQNILTSSKSCYRLSVVRKKNVNVLQENYRRERL